MIFPSTPRVPARPAPSASPTATKARPACISFTGKGTLSIGTASTANVIAAMMKQSSARVMGVSLPAHSGLTACPAPLEDVDEDENDDDEREKSTTDAHALTPFLEVCGSRKRALYVAPGSRIDLSGHGFDRAFAGVIRDDEHVLRA